MAELSNENLSLWLKARDGLPCEEARALIERLQEEEGAASDVEDSYAGYVSPADHDAALAEAREATDAYESGKTDGYNDGFAAARRGAATRISRIVQGPGWGPPPTKAEMVAELLALAEEWSRKPETV